MVFAKSASKMVSILEIQEAHWHPLEQLTAPCARKSLEQSWTLNDPVQENR